MALTSISCTAMPYADGRDFGETGPFEELRGFATFAVDPSNPLNQIICDLDLAPRSDDGKVHFRSEVSIVRAVEPSRRNGCAVLDVVNRGNPIAAGMVDTAWRTVSPTGMRNPGDGWMLQHGFTVVACAWQHDVPPRPGALAIEVPHALENKRPVTGRILSIQDPDLPSTVLQLSNMGHVPTPAVDVDEQEATLTERDYPAGPGRIIPRERWRFARPDGAAVVPDPCHVYYEEGFTAGHIYEIVYTGIGAPLTGLGLLAMRDFVSFLRFGEERDGNPCAGEIDHVIGMGASQTGRLLRNMLYYGLCEDEYGRLAIDGVLAHIAGARLNEANTRFGQPSFNGLASMSAVFPFADGLQPDPVTGREDGLLKRLTERGKAPKVFHTNSSAEYWGPQHAALVHTLVTGKADAQIPANVRIYAFSGTQHSPAPLPLSAPSVMPGRGAYPPNTIDYRPLLRAAFVNLHAWVTEGKEPPRSLYPNLGDGTLVEPESIRSRYATMPGPGMPEHLLRNAYVDFGPSSTATGRPAQVPPVIGPDLPALVPAIDADGNELGGIRHPDIEVPLATYTGWNPRHPELGGEDQPLRATGASIVFPATRHQREEKSDPRPSIEERYTSIDDYVAHITRTAEGLVQQRYLLPEDVEVIVEYSRRRYAEFTGAG